MDHIFWFLFDLHPCQEGLHSYKDISEKKPADYHFASIVKFVYTLGLFSGLSRRLLLLSPAHILTPSPCFLPTLSSWFSCSPQFIFSAFFFTLHFCFLFLLSPLYPVEWWCAVVSPLRGIISVVWERSNLTCPVRLKVGCVRLDLSHTARILPSHETSGLPSPPLSPFSYNRH